MGRGRREVSSKLLVAAVAGFICCGGDSPTGTSGEPCGIYPEQSSSMYILPYEVGQRFVVGQGNCSEGSHAASTLVRFAYDFLMPVGTPIVAAREGTVLLVEERYSDRSRIPGQENYINIVHSDGTIAAYVHLTKKGARVEVGQRILQGERIGISGDTGSSSEPHLHFHVQSCEGCSTQPVTFRNTRPHPMGLEVGQSYAAEPYRQ